MSKHHPDLVLCRRQPGIHTGQLCKSCEGKCPICDSQVNMSCVVHICDECALLTNTSKCIICSNTAVTEAYYCQQCTLLEKDRDGCPNVINLGKSKADQIYKSIQQKS